MSDFTETPADTIVLSDTGDQVVLSESTTRTVGTTQSDSVTLSDSIVVGLVFAQSLGDNVTLSDLASVSHGFTVSLSDTVTLSDLVDTGGRESMFFKLDQAWTSGLLEIGLY